VDSKKEPKKTKNGGVHRHGEGATHRRGDIGRRSLSSSTLQAEKTRSQLRTVTVTVPALTPPCKYPKRGNSDLFVLKLGDANGL